MVTNVASASEATIQTVRFDKVPVLPTDAAIPCGGCAGAAPLELLRALPFAGDLDLLRVMPRLPAHAAWGGA